MSGQNEPSHSGRRTQTGNSRQPDGGAALRDRERAFWTALKPSPTPCASSSGRLQSSRFQSAVFTKGGVMKACVSLFAIFLVASSSQAQETAPYIDSIRQEEMRADLFFLASDQLRGRYPTTRESLISAEFIQTRFERLGLKPAGPDGSYYQRYNMMHATLGEGNSLDISQGENRTIHLAPRTGLLSSPIQCQRTGSRPGGLRRLRNHRAEALLRRLPRRRYRRKDRARPGPRARRARSPEPL